MVSLIFCTARSSLNQLTAFQHARTPSNYLQSTTLTTTSGLGSNYTSYTTDPIDSSLGSFVDDNKKPRFIQVTAGTSSSFLESDLPTTDEYLYVPEGEHSRFMTPQKMNLQYESTCYGGESEARFNLNFLQVFIHQQISTFQVNIPT